MTQQREDGERQDTSFQYTKDEREEMRNDARAKKRARSKPAPSADEDREKTPNSTRDEQDEQDVDTSDKSDEEEAEEPSDEDESNSSDVGSDAGSDVGSDASYEHDEESEEDEDDGEDDEEYVIEEYVCGVVSNECSLADNICDHVGITPAQYRKFVRGSLLAQNMSNTQRSLIEGVSDHSIEYLRPFLKSVRLPFADQVASASLVRALHPLEELQLERREKFINELIEKVPNGGIAFKTFLGINEVLMYVVAAHALASATLTVPTGHEEEDDMLNLLFGDLTDEELRAIEKERECHTVDGAVVATESRVREWVSTSNNLGDAEFIRRVVLNIAGLDTPLFRRQASKTQMLPPICYKWCDNRYHNHDNIRMKKLKKIMLRVELRIATDGSDGLMSKLQITDERLRRQGCGSMCGYHKVDSHRNFYYGGVVCMAQKEINIPALNDSESESKANVNSELQLTQQLIGAFCEVTRRPLMERVIDSIPNTRIEFGTEEESFSTTLPDTKLLTVNTDLAQSTSTHSTSINQSKNPTNTSKAKTKITACKVRNWSLYGFASGYGSSSWILKESAINPNVIIKLMNKKQMRTPGLKKIVIATSESCGKRMLEAEAEKQ